MTDRSVKDMEEQQTLTDIPPEVRVSPHADGYVAEACDPFENVRARGYGPTPESALEDLHLSLY